MKSIHDYIFSISSKKLAFFVVILPVILILLHTAFSIIYRNIENTNIVIVRVIGYLFLIPILIIALWLRATVSLVRDKDLGLPIKVLQTAYLLFFVYIFFNLSLSLVKLINEEYRYIFYSLSEFINGLGLLIAYPIMCHYAARAIVIKKTNETSTFSNSIGYTLLLVFMPFSIPFFHDFFSSSKNKNQRLVPIYLIAFAILILLAIATFVSAVLGLV